MAKTELEEAGLETEGMVESTSKLRSEILALTGVDIMENANEFKSTYKIMDELAQKWEDLSDIQQATVTELIAGKRQGNIVSSLMTNFDTARKALDTSMNSAGSAMAEHEKWMQSVEASVNKVKAAWQSLSQSFLKSDFLKGLLGTVAKLADGFAGLIDTIGTLPTLLGVVAAGFSAFKNKGFLIFDKQTQSIKLFGTQLSGLGDKYASVQSKITRYNSLSAKSQEVLRTRWANSNTTFGKYISGLNGAKASFGGYIASLVGATIKTVVLEAATMALNAAITMGISFAISALIKLLDKAIETKAELAERVDELTSKFREQSNELKKLQGDYDTTNESSMISRYEKLSKGVDSLGRNVSLTADEYSEYQSIVNQIAEQIPSLVSGYDSQGNAILSCKGNVEELTAAYEKLIHAQNQEILSNASDIEKNWENVLSQANGYDFWEAWGNNWSLDGFFGGGMDDFDMKTDTAKWLGGLTSDTSPKEINDYIDSFMNPSDIGTHIRKRKEVIQALQKADYDVGFWTSQSKLSEVLADALKNEPHKIKGILDNYYAQFDEDVAKYKTEATALLSEAFDISSNISGLNYGNISEDLQSIAYQTVNSLDFQFLDELKAKGKSIEDWTTEMLTELNSIGKDDRGVIETGFDLQTKFNGGEISYGEYIDGLNDVERTLRGLRIKDEVKSQIRLSLGLDEKGLVKEYQQLRNRLADNELFDIMPSEYEPFLKGLSAEELSVLVDIIPELSETDYKETIADVKAALEKEMMLQGLTFDLSLEVEAAGLEALNTALAESVSATGLSSESIAALKGRYADLESQGYDLSSMFEETSTGIRLNRQEFNKLENAYTTDKLADIDGDLEKMKSAYDDLGEAIKNCDDPIKKSELFNDRQTLAQRISEAATLAHQYKGLTSAYNDWLSAEEAGQERDMYEKIIEGFENVDDEISRGWVDDGTIEFLELLTGRTDLAGKSGKQLKEVYDGLDKTIGKAGYSIRDFFTVNEDGDSTNTGVYNFLETIESLGGKYKEAIKRDGNGNIIGFNFEVAGGDEAIADALGISEELVQIMVRAADDAGFVVSMDGTYRQLADLQNEAKAAADYLHKIGKTDFEFDFNTSSVENLKTQLEEAHKILKDKKFWNKDGTFNFNADGATQAMQVVSTLQAKLDKLTEEQYGIGLTVEDEEFEEPLENLQEYGRTVQTLNQLKLNPKVNADKIEELEGNLEEIAKYFAGLDGDLKVDLGLDADDNWEEVKKKIETGEVKIPTVLDIQANMDKNIETLADLALLNSGLLSEDEEKVIEKKYKIEAKADEVDTSDVEDKVENAVIDGLGNPILSREANIEIIANTFGIEDVDDLSSKLEGLDDKTIQAIAEAVGKGDVEGLDIAIADLDGNTVQAVAEALGYSDVETLKAAVRNMEGNEVDAKVDTSGQAEKVWTLQDVIDGLKGKVVDIVVNTVKTVKTVVENGAAAGKKALKNRFGIGGVNGTANVDGTTGRAFKQGSWGTKNSGTALVGELGAETLVRNGRYYTIGDAGAEFIKYQKGDIIFNHRQTEELFKNGRVTSGGGRGKAFAEGTAFSKGSGGIGKVIYRVDASGSKEESKPSTKTATKNTKKKKITVKNTTEINTNGSSGEGEAIGGVDKVEGEAVGTQKDKKEFEETFDWIETAISRIEREIDNLDRTANSTYKSWSERNKALASEISKVSEEIKLQKDAASKYLKEANSVGLTEVDKSGRSYAEMVREGTLDISTLNEKNSSEELIEKIKNYQKWYNLYLECTDAAEELREEESKLYAQRFENVQTQYDSILQGFEHTESMLNEYISQAEAKGHIISREYYDALIANEKQNIATLKREQADLIVERDKAVAEGKIAKGIEAWYEQCEAIDEVTQAIEASNTKVIEFNNSIRDIEWEVFDLIQERISDITDEADFLIELMSNKDLFDDNGKFTSQGVATVGLHGQNYNTYMYQADLAGKEAEKLKKQLASDPYDTELESRYREMIALQREYILAAEDSKNSIVDLVEEGINLELEALDEKIQKYEDALESQKDLYDYQKRVEEQTKEISSLQKQLSAYEGDNSEEAKAKIQELRVSLEEAESDLQETEYDKYIADQSALLDNLYTEYELLLNERLDNTDALIQQVIDGINAAAGAEGYLTTALGSEGTLATILGGSTTTIKETLEKEAADVGAELSTAMNNIWSVGDGNAKSVLTMYGEGFQNKQTTTNTVLNSIKSGVDSMVASLNKEATKKTTANKTKTSAKANPTNNKVKEVNISDTDKKSSGGDGKAKVGDRVKFVSGQYYYDSQGKKPLGSLYQGKQVYITKINTASWATHPYHISVGSKLGSHDLGWLKLNQISGYATGKKNLLNDEYAWTQENGQEYIVRPSDGAILTPVAKGDSVLTSAASNNIWNMANNPAEFIKDNLNLGSTSVPNNSTVQNSCVQNFDKIVFSMPNVRNYDELLAQMQKDPNFERLVEAMSIGRLAGKSSLAKGKAIR